MTHKFLLSFIFCLAGFSFYAGAQKKPNVIIIYADDLGYGDLSCYGATKISTPNIDALAKKGLRFTNGHSTASTCTPSRYSLMTGRYAWRKKGTGVLPGDAALIVPTDNSALPSIFQQAGYKTGLVGKWHLGLGNAVEKDWNKEVTPGPRETGFDYSFIFPATADRVPNVFLENQLVVGLDANDPIMVDYKNPVGDEPTGKDHPELLKMPAEVGHGHNQTIVNGVGRIGYMKGGKLARWTDEELPFTFLTKAKSFIEDHQQEPFFLYYALTEPHVPRLPATMFKGKSELGYRGDVILQLDWAVGEITKQLKHLGLDKNTIIIFSSDNGPVVMDGYEDGGFEKLNGHKPAGILRGSKYSILEGGTRAPFIVSWPAEIKPGVSDALVSQIDFLASFAGFFNLENKNGIDSKNIWNAFMGKDKKGRDYFVEQSSQLAIVKDNWKYIRPSNGLATYKLTHTDTGNLPTAQLYNLTDDLGEKNNVAEKYPEKVKELEALLNAEEARTK
ncbi:sulfatase family protein [Pedobacter endophyticus]|uniref:Arylsulfatase n=1 Tax=Pedobacter endophyticus TaxID=2789740 RepID=A0A7S9KY94_9SPHI|nr:arylsulfatase [Pedobacter endophyticus]QPH39042.1 arylsulfatase [Pedobacter endophyticus]